MSPIDTAAGPGYHYREDRNMTAKDRRRNLYQRISQARQDDPELFARRASAADNVARQAFRSSLIEGCKVNLDQLREAAGELAKSRS